MALSFDGFFRAALVVNLLVFSVLLDAQGDVDPRLLLAVLEDETERLLLLPYIWGTVERVVTDYLILFSP
jgi:hypothetical protein